MSLKNQLILFIFTLLLAVLGATFWLNLDNTRDFLQNQLEVHAQDTATSLGVTLSHAVEPDDLAMMETFINAVFDRGYYLNITLTDPDGKERYRRDNPLTIEGVPQWFINLIDLHPATAHAEIMAGWVPAGEIHVTSHPGYAYVQLWNTTLNLLLVFAALGIAAALTVWRYLAFLLKPLRAMVEQAEAIVQKRYILQEPLPNTLELRRVVEAMNTMITRLRAIFEREARINARLQKMAYEDDATGLGNRAYFDMVLESLLTDETDPHPGTLAIVHLDDLQAVNRRHGYPTGSRLVKALAEQLLAVTRDLPGAIVARLNGSDFAIVVPQTPPARLATRLEPVADALTHITERLDIDPSLTHLAAGLTDYAHCEARREVLARANAALTTARADQRFLHLNLAHPPADEALINRVLDAVNQERLQLLAQPVTNRRKQRFHDLELLSRLQDADGTSIPAGLFVPLLVELSLEAAFDRLVLCKALDWLRSHADDTLLAINLTPSVLKDAAFQQTLLETIPPALAPRLAFEIPEHFLSSWPEHCEHFIRSARDRGCRIGFDHFGRQLSDKHTLRRYMPDYIKLSLGFSETLQQQEDKTLSYLASLIEMARNLDIEVIATGIENERLLNAYAELGIDWFQGFHLFKPVSLNDWHPNHD